MADTPAKGFDPSQHLSKVKGNDYLETKWRLVWLRDVYPSASLETELIAHTGNQAIFKATVVAIDPDGVVHGKATGWGSCDVSGFAAYIEKAETKAIGRALAALGFGTQFSAELDDSEDLVDSPVNRGNGNNRQQQPTRIDNASIDQKNMIVGLGKQLGMVKPDGHHDGPKLDDSLRKRVGAPLSGLTKQQASDVIDMMQKRIAATQKPKREPTAEEMDAALNNSTPGSLPLDMVEPSDPDRYTR